MPDIPTSPPGSTRHILCLYPWLALGGADKFNQDMLACLTACGWQATIVTTLPSANSWRGVFERITPDIVDLTRYPPEQYPARLLHLIGTRPIDCVLISNSNLGYRLLPYLRAHLPHISYIDYCHMEEMHWNAGGYPRMSLHYAPLLDLQVVSSRHLKRWMRERGGDPERIAVCTTNINSNDWDPARYDRVGLRAALGIPATAPVVLYAARLEWQKQPMLAVRIMREVVRRAPNVTFLVAGDGTFTSYIRGFVRWHGLERHVRMLGAVSNERMRELLALSDILFLPSQMEGISLAIYEAMAMGVVPLGAAVGGQSELVTPDCGILIERGPDEQATYIAALLRLVGDPALVRRMRQAARQRVSTHFRLEQMGARMQELLANARALHHTRPRPPVPAPAALAAARAAIVAARQDELWIRQQNITSTMRRLLRLHYHAAVERGAWWLVPLIERARRLGRPG